jgi:hypothetical protein
MAVIAGTAIAAVGLQGVGMISDFLGSKKSASAAKKAAQKQAADERLVTAEKIRQLNKEERTMAGDTRARAAGSHVKAGQGSPLEILAEQAREFTHERNINKKVGASKAASALQRGRDVGNAVKYQSYSNLAKGASSIFSIINEQGKNSTGQQGQPSINDSIRIKKTG